MPPIHSCFTFRMIRVRTWIFAEVHGENEASIAAVATTDKRQ